MKIHDFNIELWANIQNGNEEHWLLAIEAGNTKIWKEISSVTTSKAIVTMWMQ